MGLLNFLFGGGTEAKDTALITEALRDQENPLLNEAEAKEAVAEYKRRGSKVPFWNFLRTYKETLRRQSVARTPVCGQIADDGGVEEVVQSVASAAENLAYAALDATSEYPSLPGGASAIDTPAPAPQTSSWNSDTDRTPQADAWESSRSPDPAPDTSNYSSGSNDYSGGGSDYGSGGSDYGGGGGGGDFGGGGGGDY